jgi:hypothetical protein
MALGKTTQADVPKRVTCHFWITLLKAIAEADIPLCILDLFAES